MTRLKLKPPPTPLERHEQTYFFDWLPYCPRYHGHSINDFSFACPNGSYLFGDVSRRAIQGNALKAQGVKAGVPDVFVMIPVHPYHGLAIEFKRIDGAKPSLEQKEWQAKLIRQGYRAEVCYGFEEAKAVTIDYFWPRP